VIFHTPGPAWQAGVDFREQPGVREHVMHYRQFDQQDKLALGGPFLTADLGGMMVTIPGLSLGDVKTFAASDPAVVSGLLRYEIRSWHTPFEPG
jgi:uncharacterized protein YciI